MTLSHLDELGGAMRDLRDAVSAFEDACTPDEHDAVAEPAVTRSAAALERAHQAWNRAFEAAQPVLPAPCRPRGWYNTSRINGCG
jgi:hypothetical protein